MPPRDGTLWLVGLMGAGKSAVGAALAARLGRAFADTDEKITRDAGQSIPEIFAAEGEEGFRSRERAAIDALAGQPLVVALGGGAMAQPGMPERLAETGTVAYLRARVSTLLARVGSGEGRPLLAGLDEDGRRAKLEDLLETRRPAYERAAWVVETDDRDVEAIAGELAARWEAAA